MREVNEGFLLDLVDDITPHFFKSGVFITHGSGTSGHSNHIKFLTDHPERDDRTIGSLNFLLNVGSGDNHVMVSGVVTQGSADKSCWGCTGSDIVKGLLLEVLETHFADLYDCYEWHNQSGDYVMRIRPKGG